VWDLYEVGASNRPAPPRSVTDGMRGTGGDGTGIAAAAALDQLRASSGLAGAGTLKALWSGPVPGAPVNDPLAAVAVFDADGAGSVLVALCQGTSGDRLVAGAGRSVPVQPTDDPTLAESRQRWDLVSTAVATSADLVAYACPNGSARVRCTRTGCSSSPHQAGSRRRSTGRPRRWSMASAC
jgi:hypothetical protein